MLRFIQMIFLPLIAGPTECVAKAIMEERWHFRRLERSLALYTSQWDTLNQRLLASHPMLDSRFIEALLRHFGDGSEFLCQFTRNGETVGLCILKPNKLGIWTSFRPPQTQIAPLILESSSGLEKLLSHLPGLAGQVDLLCQDPHFSPASQCKNLPIQNMNHTLTMSVRLEGSFDAYWASRAKSLRHVMRTRENRLTRENLQPRLRQLDAPEDMRGAVARFGTLESSGWKGRAGTAVSGGNIQGRFYGDILENFARTGQGRVYEYWLGERLAASQLAILSERMLLLLKISYDEEFAFYSPGRLLLREVIREGFACLPGGVIEFYTDAGPEQLAWATDQRWIEHISLYRNPSAQRLSAALRSARKLIDPITALIGRRKGNSVTPV